MIIGSLLRAVFRALDLKNGRLRKPPNFVRTPKEHRQTAEWIVRYTNRARAANNLPKLERYLAIQSAAQGHSRWMARTKSFTHAGQWGTSAANRVKAAGYGGGYVGENIYRYPSRRDRKRLAKALVDGWMKSPGHRKNILNRDYKHLGVGVASAGRNIYATQNFGG